MSFVPLQELEAQEQAQAAPPPAEAPPPQQEAPPSGFVPAQEQAAPQPGLGGVPAAPPAEPAPGPFEGAVRGAGEALGGAIAPVMEQAPEPVQNLANIVGQPVGGLVDAATNVTGALGQGDVPGAAMAALEPAMAPGAKVAEQVGGRVARGESAVIDPAAYAPEKGVLSPVLDPLGETAVGGAIGDILSAPLPGTENLPPPPTAFGAAAAGEHPEEALTAGGLIPEWLGIDDWAQQNPDVVQEAYATGGGQGVVDAFINSVSGVSTVPPPQLSNPLDAATSANPVERALQIAGAAPEFVGGWGESAKQGTLGPFLKSQAIYGAMDPLSLLPAGIGEGIAARAGRAVGRVPGLSKLTDLTPEETARLAQEQRTTAAGEFVTARGQQISDPLLPEIPPPTLGAAPASVPTPPPVPEPRFVSQYRGLPWEQRPVAYTPEGPIFRDQLLANRPPTARNVPSPDPPPKKPPVRNTTDAEIARGATPTPEPTGTPTRQAIGLKGSRWVDVDGAPIVERAGSPQAAIRPQARPQVDAAYRQMFDAPAEQFYAPYRARFFDADVPASDQGLLARYRGAMTQGLYMLDDWPAERVARQLPAVTTPTGQVDWAAVERLSATGSEQARVTARKALAGKRAYDLYVHRVSNAADPDLEVRNLLMTYHLDQVSGRFDAPQYSNTSYWRDRAAALGEIIRDAGYLPSPEAINALRAMNLADEARTAFPDIPANRLRTLEGESPFVSNALGPDIAVRTPRGETIPVISVVEPGAAPPLSAMPDEAPPAVTPEQVAPEVTPTPLPDMVVPPEEVARRQTVRAAYGSAPLELQRSIEEAMPEAPTTSRYGIVVSDQAARELASPAEGRFKFTDGSEPRAGLTSEDVINELLIDVQMWAEPERMGNWPDPASARLSREWQRLDKKFNPDGDLDAADFAGADRLGKRDELALRIYDEAQTRALPPGKKPGKISSLNQTYLAFLRQNILFNYLNVPRYFLQNLLGNSVNITARGGGPRTALGMFTNIRNMGRVFRNQKSGYVTQWGAIEKAMGLGHLPNIPQSSHMQYLDRLGSRAKMPRGLEALSKVFTSDTAKMIANIPDQGAREHVATHAAWRGYHKLNQELPGIVMEELRLGKLGIPDAKVRQVLRDFLDSKRTLIDPNTGRPYTNLIGRPARFEPVWEGHELRKHLLDHLTEDMIRKPDAQVLRNRVDRVFRTTQTRRRQILDDAGKQVDDALFSWRNTNADQLASRVFLFHYFMSHQGGLYVSEAMKRPIMLSTYGRMMEEMEQQAAALDQPAWLQGFFQMMNSPAGFTIWYSPFDMFQSIFTFAEYQYGEDAADAVFKDLTPLGKGASQIPFFLHPLIQYVGYATGMLGPDYYTPSLTGLETFGAKAIDLLNLANAQGQGFMAPFNALGVGVDENGNKVPLPVRPLQELYARVANAASTALEPITGLTPVEVSNMARASDQRDIASILEQNARLAHPDWDQMQVNRSVTEWLADPGSDEYQAAFRQAAEMAFMGDTRLPGILQGAARLFSPIRTYGWTEQTRLDSWSGLEPSGALPPRNLPTDPELAEDVFNEAKYGPSTTVEGRRITQMQTEFSTLTPQPLKDARNLASNIYNLRITEPITVGGVEYTPEQLAAIKETRKGDLYDLATQALADLGYTREDIDASYEAEARFKADHPDFAQFKEYQSLVGSHPGGPEGFVMETAAINPGFAQFVRSSMMDHSTGEIDYNRAFNPDAYLATQGVRPSVYSPIVGNEPTTTPGGYPALAGIPQGQPILPQVTTTSEVQLMGQSGGWDNPVVATLGPGTPMQVVDATPYNGMIQVSLGNIGGQPLIGYVDSTLLQSNAPAVGSNPAAAPSNPVQPQGGLAGLAGNVVNQLGAAKDALGNVVTSIGGHNSGTPTKPAASSVSPGYFDVVPSIDGMGVQTTIAADRTWMELMIGNNNAIVTTDYKGETPGPWYGYQIGHGADETTHAAYDISCDTGYRPDGTSTCPGTPIKAPMAGKVVCSGYGQGTGESLAGCTYSQATTNPTNERGEPSAHTVVLDVGTDVNGNALQLSFNHMGSSALQPGQMVNPGDLLGGMGDTEGGPHVHLEAWGFCPSSGTYHIIDPALVVNGYYAQNAVC